MSTSVTPTSALEAVNSMLASIGEARVNSLVSLEVHDAVAALDALNTVNREVQAQGWYFNTIKLTTLTPDNTSKEIRLPLNTLEVDTTDTDRDREVVLRGQRLFDLKENSYQFTVPLKVTLVQLLDFEELPEAARNYIQIRATRRFQQGAVGSQVNDTFNREDEIKALSRLKQMEARTSDRNIFKSPDAMRIWARNRAWR